MEIKISNIAYYLPSEAVTNSTLSEEFPEWSAEKIAKKVGISRRMVAAEDESVSDMATRAAQILFNEIDIPKEKIDYIILCTQSPDYFLPTTACIIQEKLGLPRSIGAIDFNQGCSGFVYGLSLAKGLLASGDFKNILLITAETYSKYIHPRDKGNRTLFGDAAAAVVVSSETGHASIGRFVLGTDGRGAENLIVKRGAAKYPKTTDHSLPEEITSVNFNENYLFMNGTEIFNFTIDIVPKLISDTLAKNDASFDDIDLFVFHQANQFMLDHLKKKLKVPNEKFLVYMENCGNTVSSTIPIALANAISSGKITAGNKVLIVGFGVGYSWGATLLKF
jgi:3-oxoacyl-[acyl-carrier-protein] synthase-3